MKHLVQYHNVEEQGYDFPSRRSSPRGAPSPDDYSEIGTNKPVANLLGAVVWCVSGKDSPRKYWLRYVFVVDEVGTDGVGDALQNFARGRSRLVFDDPPRLPPVRLDTLPWFGAFRQSQGNFAFGLNTIRDEFAFHFLSLLPEGHGLFKDQAPQLHEKLHATPQASSRRTMVKMPDVNPPDPSEALHEILSLAEAGRLPEAARSFAQSALQKTRDICSTIVDMQEHGKAAPTPRQAEALRNMLAGAEKWLAGCSSPASSPGELHGGSPPPSAADASKPQLILCPVCSVPVRPDRLPRHLSRVHPAPPEKGSYRVPSAFRPPSAPRDPLAVRVTTASGRWVLNSLPRAQVTARGDCCECESPAYPRWRLYRPEGGSICLCAACVDLLRPVARE